MEKLPHDFKEFLKLLNTHGVEYLLVGGYAVNFYGYPRYTGDIDFFVATHEKNAEKLVQALKEFGFDVPELSVDLFLDASRMTRFGREPVKIEILNSISGIEFEEAYSNHKLVNIDGIEIPLISLADLRKNKSASGRYKDLDDLENLPPVEIDQP